MAADPKTPGLKAAAGQLSLFSGDPLASVVGKEARLAVLPAEGGALGGVTLPAHVLGGTSSWSFPGWGGLVYQNEHTASELAREGLAAYGAHGLFRAVGLDKTFYRPAPAAEFARLAGQVGEGFRFLVKAHRDCTNVYRRDPDDPRRTARNPRFLDANYASEAVVRPAVQGLGSRLGVILFQFSPEVAFKDRGAARLRQRIEDFVIRLPAGVPYAFELRNREVLSADYGAMLRAHGASHAYCVHPSMPSLPEQRAMLATPASARPLVVRWMLGHGRGYEEAKQRYAPFDALCDPAPEVRSQIVDLLGSKGTDGAPASILIVNNKAEGCSPRSLAALANTFQRGG